MLRTNFLNCAVYELEHKSSMVKSTHQKLLEAKTSKFSATQASFYIKTSIIIINVSHFQSTLQTINNISNEADRLYYSYFVIDQKTGTNYDLEIYF